MVIALVRPSSGTIQWFTALPGVRSRLYEEDFTIFQVSERRVRLPGKG